jgi:cytochrome c553
MLGKLFRSLIILTGCVFLPVTNIQASDTEVDRLLVSIEKILTDREATQMAIEDGQDRALLCKYCHGSDGNSIKPDVPNLAGQNARYLLEQINKFASKEREDFVMSELAAGFSEEDRINIAIFFSSQSVKPGTVDKEKSARGQALYHRACSSCHGMKGLGTHGMARLAGQQVAYTARVLGVFRKNANDPVARKESERKDSVMEAVVKDLTDNQIDDVAAYLSQMQ